MGGQFLYCETQAASLDVKAKHEGSMDRFWGLAAIVVVVDILCGFKILLNISCFWCLLVLHHLPDTQHKQYT